jgi:hypothetical protein
VSSKKRGEGCLEGVGEGRGGERGELFQVEKVSWFN